MAGLLKKYRRLSLPVKASLWFVLCGVFRDCVDVIVTPVFTRLLTEEEYGLFNVYTSWSQLLRVFLTLNLFREIYNIGLSKFEGDQDGFTSATLGAASALTLSLGALCYITRDLWLGRSGLSSRLVLLMIAQIWMFVPYYCWLQRERFAYRYKTLSLVTMLYTLLQPVLGVVLIQVLRAGNRGELRIFSAIGVQLVFGLVLYLRQLRRCGALYNKKYWKYIIRFNLPLLPHYLSQILLNQSDKLMIDALQGKAYTAIYSVSHSAAFVIQMITTNLDGALVPWLYQKCKRRDFAGVARCTSALAALSAAAVLALVCVAPEAMRLLAPSSYGAGAYVIPPLACSVYLIFIYMLFSNIELYYEQNKFVLVSSLLGAGLNILLNYLFIPVYGFVAAGYTTLFGYLVMCASHYVFLRVTCKKFGIPLGELFDMRLLLGVSLALFGACALCLWGYPCAWARYAGLLVLAGIVVLKRKSILSLWRNLKTAKTSEKEK